MKAIKARRTAPEVKEIEMAFSRKFLAALGVDEGKIDEIITAHREVVDGISAERDKYKEDAEKLPIVTKERDDLKADAEKTGKDPYKVKYEALKEDFDNYKKEIAAKETKASKTTAYKAILKEAGIADKRIDAVLKVSDVDSVELDKDGKIKDADKLLESIKTEWSDFITTKSTQGAQTANPPQSNGNAPKTREDIYKKDDHGHYVMDASQRQAAIAQMLSNNSAK